jgi:hypothetical protein
MGVRVFAPALAVWATLLVGCAGGDDAGSGAELLLVSSRDGAYALYTMDATGGQQARLTEDGEGVSVDEVFFQVEPAWSPDGRRIAFASKRKGTFDLYVDHGWYAVTRGGSRPPGADGLDVAVVGREVLDPLLGDAPGRVETAAATGDLAELVASCDRDGGALFVLRPPTLDQIVDVADRGEVMPPKTTCFAPKPYAGLFLAAGSDPVS